MGPYVVWVLLGINSVGTERLSVENAWDSSIGLQNQTRLSVEDVMMRNPNKLPESAGEESCTPLPGQKSCPVPLIVVKSGSAPYHTWVKWLPGYRCRTTTAVNLFCPVPSEQDRNVNVPLDRWQLPGIGGPFPYNQVKFRVEGPPQARVRIPQCAPISVLSMDNIGFGMLTKCGIPTRMCGSIHFESDARDYAEYSSLFVQPVCARLLVAKVVEQFLQLENKSDLGRTQIKRACASGDILPYVGSKARRAKQIEKEGIDFNSAVCWGFTARLLYMIENQHNMIEEEEFGPNKDCRTDAARTRIQNPAFHPSIVVDFLNLESFQLQDCCSKHSWIENPKKGEVFGSLHFGELQGFALVDKNR